MVHTNCRWKKSKIKFKTGNIAISKKDGVALHRMQCHEHCTGTRPVVHSQDGIQAMSANNREPQRYSNRQQVRSFSLCSKREHTKLAEIQKHIASSTRVLLHRVSIPHHPLKERATHKPSQQ